MKATFALIALNLVSCFPAHAANEEVVYRGRCIFYVEPADYANGPTFAKEVALNSMKNEIVGSHEGRYYEVMVADLTADSDLRPRRQLLLGERSAGDKKLLSYASVTFSETIPETLSMRTEKGGNFYCAAR